MKKTRTLIAVLLLLCTAALMFIPVASFEDRSADAMLEDIAKLEGKDVKDVGIGGQWYNKDNIDDLKNKNIFYMG